MLKEQASHTGVNNEEDQKQGQEGPLEDEEPEGKEGISVAIQARFARAVSELQFLGMVKPTKRKADHVARLTWGYV